MKGIAAVKPWPHLLLVTMKWTSEIRSPAKRERIDVDMPLEQSSLFGNL